MKSIPEALISVLENSKAEHIVLLDVQHLTSIADYIMICTGRVHRHLTAIADEVAKFAKAHDLPVHITGDVGTSQWVLVDLADIIVHVMAEEARAYYQLERLWGDATLKTRHGP